MRKLLFVVAALAASAASAALVMGSYIVLFKAPALGTCNAKLEGAFTRAAGAASQGATKVCFCGSDGAATPAYRWCSLAISQGAAVVCTGGSATVCP